MRLMSGLKGLLRLVCNLFTMFFAQVQGTIVVANLISFTQVMRRRLSLLDISQRPA